MSVPRGAVHAKWIVGKVIGTKMQKTAKVRVTRLVLDPYLLKLFTMQNSLRNLHNDLAMGITAKDEKQCVVRILPCRLSAKYISLTCFVNALHLISVEKFFNKRKTYFAHDPLQQCVVGDIVLLKALPERRSKHVKHELAEIVFKVGNVIDPITGKPCAGTRFLENLSDSENLTEADTTYLSEKLQELKVCSTDK